MKFNKISRRSFIASGFCAIAATKAHAQSGHDFFGAPTTDHTFIAPGQQTRQRVQQPAPQQQQPANPCGTRAEALRQRTSSSRPIEQVNYNGSATEGSIEVSIANATLYHISGQGVATAYPIGAGASSRSLIGKDLVIARKTAWPTWTPTKNIADRLNIPQSPVDGGACNPMGAYALYLYLNGNDTIYRIHGTNDPSSIGNPAASSGCIRMYNEDVTQLQSSIPLQTPVKVYAGAVPSIQNNNQPRLALNP